MIENLLTPTEVSKILRVSRSFAYQLCQTGEIVCLRIRKSIRIRPSDLEAYVCANLVGKQPESSPVQPEK